MHRPPEDPEKFDKATMQANFSSLLYLLTEQQAVIGKLLQILLEQGTINASQLTKITDHDNAGGLIPVYTKLYDRFARYYLRTKKILEDAKIAGWGILDPKPDDTEGKEKDDE